MADADPAGVVGLRLMFDIENIFIALFAFMRFRTATEAAKGAFFRSLTVYAFAYLVTAAFINHLHADSYYGNLPDLVIGVPFMLLAALALGEPQSSGVLRDPSSVFVRVVNAGSPLMLPATLLVVSAALVRGHPVLAIAGCAIAILAYGLRSILIQMRSLDDRDALERLSRIDGLTGLANRRQFDDHLRHEWARARRSGEGLAVLMIDIDHFKLLNDSLGHPVGDQRLRATAQALAGCATRASDLVARYGGEEFAAILPGATKAQATDLAEMMRAAVDRLALASPAPDGRVTVSVGVGHCAHIGEVDVAGLVAAADAALYEAKQTGRNRWTVRSL
jgi:diguanylate cyclase (GGDEF)-like protein